MEVKNVGELVDFLLTLNRELPLNIMRGNCDDGDGLKRSETVSVEEEEPNYVIPYKRVFIS